MNKKTFGLLALGAIAVTALTSCGEEPYTQPKVESETLYVKKIKKLPANFIMGMDASSVIAEEESGVKYYDFAGNEADVFQVFADNGINYIRVRVWNDPYDADGNSYGGGHNDLATAVKIGKRATAAGMKLLVDFHYSDFWADPNKQMAPKAWEQYSTDTIKGGDPDNIFKKQTAIYNYTKESLQKLKDENIDVGMVQLGNETNTGKMAGETRWDYTASLMNYGSKAVREIFPSAKVAVHFANPEKADAMKEAAANLSKYKVDYDVFGSSYYPYWHGTLDNLSSVLGSIAKTYSKQVMVMETSYANTTEDTDFFGNTIGTGGYDVKDYPFTVAGQANHLINLTQTMVNTKNAIGICYWEGAWISVGTNSWEENSAKWEKYGSGWASSYAASYDPDDAGEYYGGSAVDNQCFFDETGHPLESLKVFNLMHYGNTNVPKYIDGVLDTTITHLTTDDFTLPETVDAVYNDNSKSPVHVTWEAFDIAAAKKQGNGKYTIAGKTDDGTSVNCILVLMEENFIENYGFESGKLTPWTLTNNSSTPFSTASPWNYTAQVSKENPQTGSCNFNFWSNNANTLNVDLEQALTLPKVGTYKYQISLMGGGYTSQETQNIYPYVKINGTVAYKGDAYLYGTGNWNDFKIENIKVASGDKVTIGVHIESSAAKIWGSVDDCMFNFVE